MNRLLFDAYENVGLRIHSINGGSLRNAIPRESVAEVAVENIHKDAFEHELNVLATTIKTEYKTLEPVLEVVIEAIETPETIMDLGVQEGFLRSIYTAHNGVYRMSPDIENLVETSNNIARITLGNGEVEVLCLTRSSVESSKTDLANALRASFELSGFVVEFSGEYPGWQPNMDSDILNVLDKTYKSLNNGEQAHIAACHAGLECGILGQHYPEMEMISFGPTIRGAHSPDERASISSTKKYWELVLQVLKEIPVK